MSDTINKRPGDANQITRDYLDSLRIEMRHLDGVLPNTELQLFGKTFDTPVMMAAFSHLSSFGYHEDGMVEIARAAAAVNAVNWAGMGTEDELERIIATGAQTIKVIKPYEDNERIFRKIEHAEKAGALAVGIDIDHSFSRNGQYDIVQGDAMRPKSVAELKQFVSATKLPFVIKGVLSVTDALKCKEAGVAGIIVSHHHGILDYAVPPLMVLPKIKEAVGGSMKLFIDCSIDTGYDVFKSLALGAQAACVGRAILDPLKKGGKEKAIEKMNQMLGELAGAMARTGSPDIASIDPSVIW